MPDASLTRAAPADRALDRQNWLILGGAVAANAALLWLAAHAGHPLVSVAAAILFAFANNTVFSLLHEAVHGKFAPGSRGNAVAGHIGAAFFPTSFTLQTALHLTHHRNNRSDLERFDYIGPDENVVLKTGQWFTIVTGLYWLSIPLFWVLYAFVADLVPWRRIVVPGSRFSRQTSAGEFLESARALPIGRIRAELALSVAVQAALFIALDLSLLSWFACYFAFGLMWSSLQYADHAFSCLSRTDGAWDLRVGRFTHKVFLNYHDHLQHHRDPDVRWQHLPAGAARDGRAISWLAMLYLMWRGPRLLPGSGQGPARQALLDRTSTACHVLVFGAAFGAIYGLASRDYRSRSDLFDVSLPLDALVPFVPLWALAYVAVAPLLLVTAWVLRTPGRTLPFLAAITLQLVIGALCFLAFPVAPPAIPAMPAGTLAAGLFALADAINLTGNFMPSLHVALAVSSAWAASAHVRWPGKAALWLWALAICASTLFTYQHWLLDVAGGALLAAAVMGIAYPRLIALLARIEAQVRPEEEPA